MAKLTQTQTKLLREAAGGLSERVYFQTYLQRRGRWRHTTVGGRQLAAAQALLAQGLLTDERVKPGQTYERAGNGYRTVRWTDHDYAITEAGRAALAALETAR